MECHIPSPRGWTPRTTVGVSLAQHPMRRPEGRGMTDADHRRGSDGMARVTVRVPDALVDALDDAVDRGHHGTRSDAVRAAIRQEFASGPVGGGE